ncbi:DUF1622 domain-containing protein [Rhodoblastus sp.]|uniref:DUF1622 domain-containing protein n=1 Tax=Rhodoblastus sp. TaxID=1962975 RepID=UPI00260FAF22|nr:DUF1622 domain-containing protein [Rhodoblastus sp.]
MSEQIHAYVDLLAKALELFGVGVVVGGIALATCFFVSEGRRAGDWAGAYLSYRANIGRGILLGLELLVGADIISTITAPLTVESVGLLAGIVLIRTFLSFALETEIEGCWPWCRAAKEATEGGADRR